MKLINLKTGDELKPGDIVTTFRGETGTLISWTPPRHAGSTGRVHIRLHAHDQEFFPSVIDAQIQKEDQ